MAAPMEYSSICGTRGVRCYRASASAAVHISLAPRGARAASMRNRVSALVECPSQLVRDGLQEVAQHRATPRLHEYFRRHAGDELKAGQPAMLLLGQRDPDGIVRCLALLLLAEVRRDIR